MGLVPLSFWNLLEISQQSYKKWLFNWLWIIARKKKMFHFFHKKEIVSSHGEKCTRVVCAKSFLGRHEKGCCRWRTVMKALKIRSSKWTGKYLKTFSEIKVDVELENKWKNETTKKRTVKRKRTIRKKTPHRNECILPSQTIGILPKQFRNTTHLLRPARIPTLKHLEIANSTVRQANIDIPKLILVHLIQLSTTGISKMKQCRMILVSTLVWHTLQKVLKRKKDLKIRAFTVFCFSGSSKTPTMLQ